MEISNRRTGILLVLVFLLTGCGFHLRGTQPGDGVSQRLYIESPGATRVGMRIRDIAALTGTTLTRKPNEASAIIHILKEKDERRIMSLNLGGRGNLFDLSTRVLYELRAPNGEVILPAQELEVQREYFNNQLSPIGQGEEESQLRSEMEREAAESLIRRVLIELRRSPEKKS